MDFTCGCFRCCLTTDKGSYSTYDREKRQTDSLRSQPPGEQNNNNPEDTSIDTNRDHPQHSDGIESLSPKALTKTGTSSTAVKKMGKLN